MRWCVSLYVTNLHTQGNTNVMLVMGWVVDFVMDFVMVKVVIKGVEE
jgi:hypothetical protein